ncbi:hypothetical protein B7463_g1835, partial [Scytalidium lignicola]
MTIISKQHAILGKTTTTEHVDDGSTVTDFLPAERARGITIQSAAVTFHWPPTGSESLTEGVPRSHIRHTINLIDTPGHADFTFEVLRSLRVLDGAICILDGVAGVEAQTEKVWAQANKYNIPRFIFVNKLDRDGAAFGKTVKEVGSRLRGLPAVCQIPWWEGGNGRFTGVGDAINLCALKWKESGDGKDIQHFSLAELAQEDEKLRAEIIKARSALVESLCEFDEQLLETWLEHDDDTLAIPAEAIKNSLRRCVLEGSGRLIPIFAGASFRNIGVQPLLDTVNDLLPDPTERPDPEISLGNMTAHLPDLLNGKLLLDKEQSNRQVAKKSAAHLTVPHLESCALAFKVVNDPRRGVLVYVRVYSGTIQRNAALWNTGLQITERAQRLLQMQASDAIEIPNIPAGQIGVISGLKYARTGDTLVCFSGASPKTGPHPPLNTLHLKPIDVPPPVFFAAIEPHSLGEEKNVKEILEILLREDPSLHVNIDEESGQMLLSGMGELHLEIARDRLVNDFKAKATMGNIEISYRECVLSPTSSTRFVYDRDIAGKRGQAGCEASIEPMENATGNNYTTILDGNAFTIRILSSEQDVDGSSSLPPDLPIAAVQTALINGASAAFARGPRRAFPLHSSHVTLTFDPSTDIFGHNTTIAAISSAARHAIQATLKEAFESNNIGLMEPVMNVTISCDESSLGGVVHDISSARGGHILSLGQDSDAEAAEDSKPTIDPSKIYAPPDPFASGSMGNAGPGQQRQVIARVPLKEMRGAIALGYSPPSEDNQPSTQRAYHHIRDVLRVPVVYRQATIAQDIQIVVKTGGSEPQSRLRYQLATVLSKIPRQNVLIFSDLEEQVGSYHVRDVYADLSEQERANYPEFALYDALQEYKQQGKDTRELQGGWDLAKYMNLAMKRRIWKMQQEIGDVHTAWKKWFVFIDTDTFVEWDNLLGLLEHLDAAKQIYIGSPVWLPGLQFAHGGSAYILSYGALKALNNPGSHDQKGPLYSQYGLNVTALCCGDEALARVLKSKGVNLKGYWPMFNGELPATVPFGRELWCEPVISLHHIGGEDMQSLWQWVEDWKVRTMSMHPLLFKDLFQYIAPQITSILEDWDNIDDTMKIYLTNKASYKTFEHCKVACEADKLCFQFVYNGTSCALAHHIRLGRKRLPEENGAQRYISGWNMERIRDWTMKTNCASAHWDYMDKTDPTANIGDQVAKSSIGITKVLSSSPTSIWMLLFAYDTAAHDVIVILIEDFNKTRALAEAAAKSRAYLYPIQGIFYFLSHRSLWRPFISKIVPTITLSVGVIAFMFTFTYIPQVAVLAFVNGPFAVITAILLTLSESSVIILLLSRNFFIQDALVDTFDATLVAQNQMEVVSGGRQLKAGGDPVSKLGKMFKQPFDRFSPKALIRYIMYLPLNFIPVVGTVMFVLIQGRSRGKMIHTRYFQLKNWSNSQREEWLEHNTAAYTAFGTVATLLELVPVASIFFSFTNTVGAALWAADTEKEINATTETATSTQDLEKNEYDNHRKSIVVEGSYHGVVQLRNSAAIEPKSSGSPLKVSTLGPVATTSIESRPSKSLWTSNLPRLNIRSAMSDQTIRPSSNTPTKVSQIASKLVSKASSTSPLNAMAAVSPSPRIQTPRKPTPYDDEDETMSTLPDPRSRNVTPSAENGVSPTQHHPDLSSEVAALSNKLINAINHQTNLDDTLSATRHELEVAHERIHQLEQRDQEHTDLMVVAAREEAQKEHDAVQKKNEQLKAQLADTESLLISHQEQLAELKQVLEQMAEEKDDMTNNTAPSTPGVNKFENKEEESNETETIQPSSIPEPVAPSYPTSFTHLLQLVLRTDLTAYDDFMSLLRMSKNINGHRASSGSYGSIGLGFANLTGHGHTANGSTTSLATAATLGSSPATPTTPASAVSTSSAPGPLTPLKETKFYKRALAEDIEPTLRLDTAPGLSWLARRTVLNAMCEGSLVVDPMPLNSKLYIFPCALCGESRKDPAHVRTHRFRTSENENSQRYPLCKYCLGRVRSSCDFLGFLRVLKDGHWRVEDEEAEKLAWEESVRLREQMFWCRMGGGVVPGSSHHHSDGHLPSVDEKREQERKAMDESTSVKEGPGGSAIPAVEVIDATKTPLKRMSRTISRDDTAEGLWQAAQEDASAPAPAPTEAIVVKEQDNSEQSEQSENSEKTQQSDQTEKPEKTEKTEENNEDEKIEEIAEKDKVSAPEMAPEERDRKRTSTQSTSSLQAKSSHDGEKAESVKRLSITIPGAFVDTQS